MHKIPSSPPINITTNSSRKRIKLTLTEEESPVPTSNNNLEDKESKIVQNTALFIPEIIETLQLYATVSELFGLRQMCSAFYSQLNSTYLDRLNKTLEIVIYRTVNYSKTTRADTHSESEPFKIKVVDTQNKSTEVRITNQNWAPEVAYIFRKLILGDLWFDGHKPKIIDGLELSTFIEQLGSNITSLTLLKLPEIRITNCDKNLIKLVQFMKQFPNLEKLFLTHGNDISSARTISVVHFHTIMKSLKPKVTIYLTTKAHPDQWSILEILDSIPNNVEVNLSAWATTPDQLVSIDSYVNKYSKMIKQFCLAVDVTSRNYENADLLQVRNILELLSPRINELNLGLCAKSVIGRWDLVSGILWPKLRILKVTGHDRSGLQFLQSCPTVEELDLAFNYEIFLLYNPGTVREQLECLKSYFNNLTQLKALTIRIRKVVYQLELKTLLDQVLPSVNVKVVGYP